MGPISFDGYGLGDIHGQAGWSKTGPYDVNVVNTDRFGFGQALQISNAVTSGNFHDQTFSPAVTKPAGESEKKHFEASFDIAAATDAAQPGLAMSVSPDSGQGGRMSYLRFVDQNDGVHVFFDDFTDGDFHETDIATLDRAESHTIKFDIKCEKKADDVKIFVDGKKKATGTTWEGYYRDLEQQVPTTSKMLFRTAGAAAPGTLGNGFLIDNLKLSS